MNYKITLIFLISALLLQGHALNHHTRKKGLAPAYLNISDIDLLEAKWFYVYGMSLSLLNDPRYVPMLIEGLPDSALPSDYAGYVLVFSEPDNPGTGGHSVDPAVAAQRYAALLVEYPDARFVMGGVIGDDAEWVDTFLANSPTPPERWHTHVYAYLAGHVPQVIEIIESLHDRVGVPIWVTETGSPAADLEALSGMMVWLEATPWIERYAVFTNRIRGDESWWPSHWSVDMALIDYETGQLTAMGMRYKNLEVYEVFLPLVGK